MPSHLTRSVFRRLLANKPIIHHGCLRRRYCSSISSLPRTTRNATAYTAQQWLRYEQRRHFFNLNIFSKRDDAKEPDMDPGIEKMMELAKRQRMSARMPELSEIRTAVNSFFAAKWKKRQPVTDTQAQLVLQSLQYYYQQVDRLRESDEAHAEALTFRQLVDACRVLNLDNTPASSAHVELARLFHLRLGGTPASRSRYSYTLHAYVTSLCRNGETATALRAVIQAEDSVSKTGKSPLVDNEGLEDPPEQADTEELETRNSLSARWSYIWSALLQGFVLEGNVAEVQRTLTMVDERGFANNRQVAATMIAFSLKHNDLVGVKRWWTKYQELAAAKEDTNPAPRADGRLLQQILTWCLANKQIEAGHEIVRTVMKTNPPKPLWDATFVWAAGTKKSVDEINRMIGVMEKSNEAIPDRTQWRLPDVETINGLVEFAVSQNDPYMAERFITLGREHNIEPDARTFVLQMEYRLSVGDVDGALIAYKALAEQRNAQLTEESFEEDVATINRLIVALCKTQGHDFDTVMGVTMDLADRRARFAPETVSNLSILHLNRDEVDDATDLLNTHAYHYSSTDRAHIRDSLVNYALDPKISTARAWSSYNILRNIFDETPRDARTDLMTAFFTRDRPDMGVRIFQQMRMHSRADTIPTIDTYVAAFMGLAKLRDLESVEVVHNQLKLDFNVTPTTYLRNALIIAYTACNKGRKALGFWADIVASKEGPSYNSIHVALRACEKSPFGDLRAKELWELLRRRNVELDQALWASYVAALAGNGDNDAAITAIEEAEAKGEVEVDAFLLGSVFDGAAGQVKQEEVEGWAKERYPEVWAKLEGFGCEEDAAGMRRFGIDRRVEP